MVENILVRLQIYHSRQKRQTKQATIHTSHTYRDYLYLPIYLSCMIFGLMAETLVPKENTRNHRENMQNLRVKAQEAILQSSHSNCYDVIPCLKSLKIKLCSFIYLCELFLEKNNALELLCYLVKHWLLIKTDWNKIIKKIKWFVSQQRGSKQGCFGMALNEMFKSRSQHMQSPWFQELQLSVRLSLSTKHTCDFRLAPSDTHQQIRAVLWHYNPSSHKGARAAVLQL